MESETLDLSRICRTCKSKSSQMQSLFDEYEVSNESLHIDSMLMACSSIQVTRDDGLPSQICQVCVDQLKNAFAFKSQCERVDVSLREYVKNVKVNDIKEEEEHSDLEEPPSPRDAFPDDDTASKDSSTREGTPILVTPKIETDDVPFAATDLASKRKLVTCKVCGKEFTTRKGLRYHKRLHTGDMFKCKHCSRQYTRLNHLQRHEESHRKRKVHVCKICGKTLKRMEHLRRHLVTHLAVKPFACNTCNRSFSRVEHLQHHAPRCKGHIVFHCDICNQPFKHEDTMSLHKQTHDGQEKNQLTIENLDNIDEYYYQMEQDDTYTFSDYSDVDDGVDSPFPDSSDMGSCLEPQVEVAEHTDTEQRKEVASDDSQALEKVDREVEVKVESNVSDNNNKNEGTSSNANQVASDASGSHGTMSHYLPGRFALLQRKHDRIGRGHNSSQVDVTATSKGRYFPSREDPVKQEECVEFPCPACRAIFPAVGQLATHAREKHEELTVYKRRVMGDNRYKCTVCYKGFPTEMYLNVHMYYHNGCTMCEETFPNKALLTEHVKFHKKSIKKALCTECGRGFVRNDYLVQHMRRHRGEKPFKCQYCGKGFPRKTDLTVHERYHTRETTHLCSVCGKAFQRRYNLTTHMRLHTGEKPFKCASCEAAFARNEDLRRHMRRHTGERLHCGLCTKSFLTKRYLLMHKNVVHGVPIESSPRPVVEPVNL